MSDVFMKASLQYIGASTWAHIQAFNTGKSPNGLDINSGHNICLYLWSKARVDFTCSCPRMKTPPVLMGCQAERFAPDPRFTPSW